MNIKKRGFTPFFYIKIHLEQLSRITEVLMTKKYKKIIFIIFVMCLMAFIPSSKDDMDDIPRFRIVIDPGHGGFFNRDKTRHGDKYDLVTGKYLEYFAEGANYKGIYEHKLVYSIALKVIERLSLCSKDGDFDKFKKLIEKFTDKEPRRIYIETMISRDESLSDYQKERESDPNGPYRLYDYPGPNGEMIQGRISKINAFKPHLVISLHMAENAPPDYLGMNGIIIPPYNVLKTGFDKLISGKDYTISDSGLIKSWFQESKALPKRYYYYKDVSQYFIGYGLTSKYKPDYNDFKGYKYNMIDWSFRDEPGWTDKAREHNDYTQYSRKYNTFIGNGLFWDREKSIYEEYRRGSSFTNFGGDNYFATYELIKYVLYSLHLNGIDGKEKKPGKPFISTWSVPLLVNAISAYIELGYFNRKWDRDVLIHRQDEIADGLAVGIYSLLAGLEDLQGDYRYKPSGKCIDLHKYYITKDKSYFGIVSGNEENISDYF